MKFIILFLCFLGMTANAQEMDISASNENEQSPQIENNTTLTDEAANKTEMSANEQVVYEETKVFSQEFMKKLISCQPGFENGKEQNVTILGAKSNSCHMQYANFDLNIPFTLLGNIHSFEDIETLLKNKDIAHYNYRPEYIYDGLIYALDACMKKKNYDGTEEQFTDNFVTITRGLSSEFDNNICIISLSNLQNVEGSITDYGVTCKLPYNVVKDLESYIEDLVEKYGEKRGFGTNGHVTVIGEQQNKQTHEADIAIMYYIQQNGYCKKNYE